MWKESIFTKKIRLFVSLGIMSLLAVIIYSSIGFEPDQTGIIKSGLVNLIEKNQSIVIVSQKLEKVQEI